MNQCSNIKRLFTSVIIFILVYSAIPLLSFAEPPQPNENQYIEFRAVELTLIAGKDKQLTVEVWAYNLDIKGFSIRYRFDNTRIEPSETYFEYLNGFEEITDVMHIMEESTIETIISLLPREDRTGTSPYIVERPTIGDVINSSDGVLIGKLNFRLFDGEVTTDLIELQPGGRSPKTGIKVNFNITDSYEAPSLFKFTNQIATYGTIKGSIETFNPDGIYLADIKIYSAGTIDWDNLYGHDDLDLVVPIKTVQTNPDGTYEIEIEPGTYDVLIDKRGYLDHIYKNIEVIAKEEKDLGYKLLIPGDINKDGYIEAEDMSVFYRYYGCIDGIDLGYDIGLDYTEDGYIEAEDMSIFYRYYGNIREIIEGGSL